MLGLGFGLWVSVPERHFQPVPTAFPGLGAMPSGTGRGYMLQSPWSSVWPGLAISIVVFGFTMLGDALRDVLDARLRNR